MRSFFRSPAPAFAVFGMTVLLGCSSSSSEEPTLAKKKQALSTGLVISQVYGGGGGGSSSASFKRDYVELFNRGTTPLSLNGLSLQYAGSATASPTWAVAALPNVTVAPGKYYLVALGSTGSGVGDVPLDHESSAINMSATAGRIALVSNTTPLSCGTTSACSDPDVIDFVGYGSGTIQYEGSAPTGSISTTTAAFRKNGGCIETDENSADFEVATPSPRNSSTAPHSCVVDAGADVAIDIGILDSGAPDTTAPDTTADTTAADTTAEDTAVADTTAEDTTVADTTVADTTAEDTTVADTTAEDTTVADTTVADTTVADTTVEDTGVADTAIEDTGVADTAVEDTGVADTAIEDTGVADTAIEDTGVAETAADTAIEDTGVDTAVADTGVDTAVAETAVDTAVAETTEDTGGSDTFVADTLVEETADAGDDTAAETGEDAADAGEDGAADAPDGGDNDAVPPGIDASTAQGGGCDCRTSNHGAPVTAAGSLAGLGFAALVVARRRRR